MADSTKEYWFIFNNDHLLLIKDQDDFKIPTERQLLTQRLSLTRQHFLGIFNGYSCYCAEMDHTIPLSSNLLTFIPLKKALDLLGDDWFVTATKAFSIVNWDKKNQFCGQCGKTTLHKPGVFERLCDQCCLVVYPRISPSVIVRIHKGDEILMARSAHFPPGAYGLIAGFVEAGESLEDAVHREVWEEVRITIKDLQYVASQAWPFPDSLMIAFTANYASGDIMIDPKEIEVAGWYPFNNLPGKPSAKISLSSRLINAFIQEKTHERSSK